MIFRGVFVNWLLHACVLLQVLDNHVQVYQTDFEILNANI